MFLVGTCVDKLDDAKRDIALINTALEESVHSVGGMRVQVNAEEGLVFFPISNKNGENVSKLKGAVHSTAQAQAHTRQLGKVLVVV